MMKVHMPGPIASLRVPKNAVLVRVGLIRQKPRPLQIYVAEHQAHAFSPQSVLDLLEQPDVFLPGTALGERLWVTVNKNAVLWVAVDAPDALALELFDERRPVRVEFVGGSVLVGDLLYSPASGRARVVDHVNDGARFFKLFAKRSTYLVNKALVLSLAEEPPSG